jgi:large subunit ribosomal protein L23
MTKDPYKIIQHAFISEKSMNMLYPELKVRTDLTINSNKLTFIVHPKATKTDIKWAVEKLFSVKVEKVNIMHSLRGKKAIVRLAKGYSAEEVGSRVGVF